MTDIKQTAVILDGMARTGTSALMKTLEILGVDLGGHLLRPRVDNELGFFEDQRIWRLNNQIRAYLGMNWNLPKNLLSDEDIKRKFDNLPPHKRNILLREIDIVLYLKTKSNLWGFKNPGSSELFPIWIPKIQERGCDIKIIVNTRHPADSAESMLKFSKGFRTRLNALQLWLRYTLSIEFRSRHLKRTFVCYEDLMNQTAIVLRQLINFLDLNVDLDEKLVITNNFLTPRLRKQNVSDKDNWGVANGVDDIYQSCLEVYKILNANAISSAGFARLNQIRQIY